MSIYEDLARLQREIGEAMNEENKRTRYGTHPRESVDAVNAKQTQSALRSGETGTGEC